MPQDMRSFALALYSGSLESLARQRPQSPRAQWPIRRGESHEEAAAGASRAALLKVLQYRVANLALEWIGPRPTAFRVMHNEDFFAPIEIGQHQPGDFTAAQPVDCKQREDCSRSQRSVPLSLHGFQKSSHLLPTWSKRQILVLVDPWSLNAVCKTLSAPSSCLSVTKERTQCIRASVVRRK